MLKKKLQRLIDCYFDSPERQVTLEAGEIVIEQNGHNDRLYFVKSGELEGLYQEQNDDYKVRVFVAGEGAFIGVHSFFSESLLASATVVASSKVTLAWIDKNTAEVEPEIYGPLSAQFTPIIVNELSRRQRRATQEALAKERALQQLHTAEQMTTLGQLAAGIAHELNNAVGVISSKTDGLHEAVIQLIEESHPEASEFLDQGLLFGQNLSSSEVRERAKALQKSHRFDKNTAKSLARAMPNNGREKIWLANPVKAVKYWGIGRDLHDIQLAARHSVGIVKSVKQLGRTELDSDEWLDINDTINKALALLQSDLRSVSVHMSPASLPKFKGSSTELVQIWANIIKNACDAMEYTEQPEIQIITRYSANKLLITMTNNGPEIDEATRRKIFQPNFTTKKGGLSFGLGLGLSIVKRIVSGYGGSIAVKSDSEKTIFRIKLPVEEDNGQA
jgi:signal transduction histidine kinase